MIQFQKIAESFQTLYISIGVLYIGVLRCLFYTPPFLGNRKGPRKKQSPIPRKEAELDWEDYLNLHISIRHYDPVVKSGGDQTISLISNTLYRNTYVLNIF
jgi:hypothetical protein